MGTERAGPAAPRTVRTVKSAVNFIVSVSRGFSVCVPVAKECVEDE